MKINIQNFPIAIFLFALLLAAISCQKEEAPTPEPQTISEDEVVAIVEGAFKADSEGVAQEIEDAIEIAEDYTEKSMINEACGESFDTTVVRNYAGALLTANYTSLWGWTVNCNHLEIPVSMDFDRSVSGDYESLKMRSEDSSLSDLTVDNLIAGSHFTLNGTYNRQGTQESKVRNQIAFTTSLEISLDDVNISKGQKKIESGIASFNMTGSDTLGHTFAVQGDVVFTGNGTVTVIVNGTSYEIDLY